MASRVLWLACKVLYRAVGRGHPGQLILLIIRQRLIAARRHVAAGVVGQ